MKLIILICFFITLSTQAALIPEKENADKRITVIKYAPDNVIRVRVAVGINTLIQFEKGESFTITDGGVGLGDASAWAVDLRGNNLFLKPIAKDPDTNLSMISNKGRTYFFDLVTSKYPHYAVKLQYEKVKTSEDYKDKGPSVPCYDSDNVNFRYGKWGDNDLAPLYMWDDGRFTCLKFKNNARLPVAYQIETDGTESLVNYSLKKDTMVIHSVSKEFRLRLGKQVLGLRSENTLSNGYNDKGTSVNAKRTLNHD